jgi:hypothetical protein
MVTWMVVLKLGSLGSLSQGEPDIPDFLVDPALFPRHMVEVLRVYEGVLDVSA